MTQTIAYLEAVVGADITSFRREMQNVRRELGILSDSAAGLQHLGRTLTLGLTTPIIAAGVGAVTLASQFDAAMRNITSISQEMADNFTEVSARTLQLGSDIRGGPMSAAEALYTVVSSGITDIETAFAITEAGARTAQAGLADVMVTTQALTSVMLAYGAEADEAERYSDILTRTVQVGVGTMEEFTGALSRVVPTANLLDISFEDIGASLAFLTQRGIDASEASTALTGALKKILNPTEEMAAAFQSLGVSTGSELIEQFGGLEGAMRALIGTVMEGGEVDETALFAMFDEVRAFKAAASFANDMEAFSDAFSTFHAEVDGATERALQQQMMSFAAQFDLMKASAAGFAITVGDALLPILTPMVQAIDSLFDAARQLPPEIIAMGVAFAGVLAAAGPLLWVLGSILTPAGLLLATIAGLGTAFATNFGGVRDTIIAAVEEAIPHLEKLYNAVRDFFKLLMGDGEVDLPDDTNSYLNNLFPDGGAQIDMSEVVTFTVNPGDYPIMIAEGLREAGHNVTWEQVLAATGSDAFPPGTYTLTIPGPDTVNADLSHTTFEQPDWWGYLTTHGGQGESEDTSLGARLQQAIEKSWPRIQAALEDVKNDITAWFKDTFIPGFDSIGADVLNAIAGIFESGGEGTGIYTAIRNFLNGGVQEGAKQFEKDIAKNLPSITSAFQRLFTAIGDWLTNEGIPAAAQSLGYIIGTLGVAIREGISNLFNNEGVSDALSTAATSFSTGFSQAMIDSGHTDTSFLDDMLTGLAGAIAVALAGKAFVGLLIGKGIGPAIGGAIGLATKGMSIVFDAASWVVSFAGGAIAKAGGLSGIALAISNFVGGALAAIGAIPIGTVAIALAGIALGFLLVNYDARVAVADFLKTQLGVDPVSIDIIFGINPILDMAASQDAAWQAVEDNGAEGLMNYLIFGDSSGNSNVVDMEARINVTPTIDVGTPEGNLGGTGGAGSAGTIATDQEFLNLVNESTAPKFIAQGEEIGTKVKEGLKSELSGDTSTLIEQAIGAELLATDYTIYVPIENLTLTAEMMAAPIKDTFTTLLGEDGTLHTLFINFGTLIADVTPDIVAAATTLVDGLMAVFEPLYNMLYGVVVMLGGLSGNPNMGLDIPSYASGGSFGGAGFIGGRGPEFFAPGENGSILPARKLRDWMTGSGGNRGGDTIIINSYGENPHRLARMVERSQRDRARSGNRKR